VGREEGREGRGGEAVPKRVVWAQYLREIRSTRSTHTCRVRKEPRYAQALAFLLYIFFPPSLPPSLLPLLSVLGYGSQTAGAASRACAGGVECGDAAFIRNIMGDYYPGMSGEEEGRKGGRASDSTTP